MLTPQCSLLLAGSVVVGDVKGQLDKLFTRIAAVNKKAGPFDVRRRRVSSV